MLIRPITSNTAMDYSRGVANFRRNMQAGIRYVKRNSDLKIADIDAEKSRILTKEYTENVHDIYAHIDKAKGKFVPKTLIEYIYLPFDD